LGVVTAAARTRGLKSPAALGRTARRASRAPPAAPKLIPQTKEQPRMSTDEIRAAVKQSVASIANLDVREIGDDASYKEDLQLDSLTILEIAVDAEYKFQVNLSEDDLAGIGTVADTVRIVEQYLSAPVTAAA
jgi:acyl carrier protein